MVRSTIGNISLFGWLNKIPVWSQFRYPIKGGILRGLKAALSFVVAALVTAAVAGTLFPADWAPIITLVLTALLQGLDKYIREWNVDQEKAEGPNDTSDGSNVIVSPTVKTDTNEGDIS